MLSRRSVKAFHKTINSNTPLFKAFKTKTDFAIYSNLIPIAAICKNICKFAPYHPMYIECFMRGCQDLNYQSNLDQCTKECICTKSIGTVKNCLDTKY